MKYALRPARILDFDIENRPLSYLGGDFTTSEITAIAAGWCGTNEPVESRLLYDPMTDFMIRKVDETYDDSARHMLSWFVQLYDWADIVTGHYILMHDLPIINGALLEHGLPRLGPKLVSDTKVHLVGGKGVSKSQESLSDMLGVPAQKYHMTQAKWRAANRLTPEGIKETQKRVEDDVRQHMLMRKELVAGGYLKPPVLWRGGSR